MSLYSNVNFLSKDNRFLLSKFIREYDISKANINILFKYGVFNKDEYKYFYNANRTERQIKIGLLLQRQPDLNNVLQNGIIEAKKLFFEANDIQDSDVLAIKNDAVYLIDKNPKITKFDNIEFLNKNTYTSFYLLGKHNIELYYHYDIITNNEILDVKGIGNEKLKLHEPYFLEFLKVCFNSAQVYDIKDTLDVVINFYNSYLNRNVDVGYYRNFDSESAYLLNSEISDFTTFKAYNLNQSNINDINIIYNLELIRELYQYYASIDISRR